MELTNKERAVDLLLRIGPDRVRIINGLSGPLVTFQRATTTDNVKARQLRPELVAFAMGAMLWARLEAVLSHYGADTRLRPWLQSNPDAAARLVEHFTRKHGPIEPEPSEAIATALEGDTAQVFDAGHVLAPAHIRQLQTERKAENREVRERLSKLLAADSRAVTHPAMPDDLAEDLATVAILDDLTEWGNEA